LSNGINKHVTAVILAAGSSTRMGMEQSKHLLTLCGDTVLGHCLRAFEMAESIASIVVVAREDELSDVRALIGGFNKVIATVAGGDSRAESARLGFAAIPAESQYVAIHDAARCLITSDTVDAVVRAGIEYGASTAGARVYDTVKMLDDEGYISGTVSRDKLFFATTPQVFRRELYSNALAQVSDFEGITDDNSLLERIGVRIYPVDTGRGNIKLTTADDVKFAEFLLNKRARSGCHKLD